MADTTIGYKYSFGIHMGLCRGLLDSIVEIRVGDRPIFNSLPEESGILQWLSHESATIDKPELFGGEEGEGGIVGELEVLFGDPDQVAPVSLLNMLGSPLPGYRGVTTVFFNGMIAAMNPYPKPWKFRTRGLGDYLNYSSGPPIGIEAITMTGSGRNDPTSIVAMNPVSIIYQALTSRIWGRGLPAYMIDETNFFACKNELLAELFGLCLKWSRQDSIDVFVQQILDHIGGTMFTDRTSGLIKLKLIRADYDIENVPLFDQELGVCEITEAVVVSNAPLINEVRVTYRDPITNEDRIAVARNPASLQSDGQSVNSLSKEYKGLPTPELAAKVAQRDLKAQGAHLRRFTIKMNRIGWKVEPGGVIQIQDLARGITPVVVRVGAIIDGGLGNGGVTIKAIQDVFALPATTFAGSEPPRWIPPSRIPCIGEHKVFEMPYFLLSRVLPHTDFDALPDEAAFIGTVCDKGQPLNIAYKIAVRADAPDIDDEPADGYYCDGYTPP